MYSHISVETHILPLYTLINDRKHKSISFKSGFPAQFLIVITPSLHQVIDLISST